MPTYKHIRTQPAHLPPNWSFTRVEGDWEQGEGSVVLPGEVVKISLDLDSNSGFEKWTAPAKKRAPRKKKVEPVEEKEEEKAEQESLLEG